MNQEERTALFVGHTGSGKTSICAGLTGDRAKFKPNDSLVSSAPHLESHTLLLESKNAEWIRDGTQYKITIVDAPGFNDTTGLDDVAIMNEFLHYIEANNHKLTSLFLCLSHKKIGEAELKGVVALLDRFRDTHLAEITTILLTHAEGAVTTGGNLDEQRMGRLIPLAQSCGGRVEFVGFPYQEQYNPEHQSLKEFNEQSVDRFRAVLLRNICGPPRKYVYAIDFKRVMNAEKAMQEKLAQHAREQHVREQQALEQARQLEQQQHLEQQLREQQAFEQQLRDKEAHEQALVQRAVNQRDRVHAGQSAARRAAHVNRLVVVAAVGFALGVAFASFARLLPSKQLLSSAGIYKLN